MTSESGLPWVPVEASFPREQRPPDWDQTGLAYAYSVSSSNVWATERPKWDVPYPYVEHRQLADRLSIVPHTGAMITRTFTEILDPDAAKVHVIRSWGAPGQDAAAPYGPSAITKDHEDLLARLFALGGTHGKVIDVALRRLNLARRRMSRGDSAIDTAIALEALLTTPEEKSEIAYRLKLRAALFLETDIAARTAVRSQVNELYALRSEVMHAGTPRKKDPHQIVDLGLDVAQRVVEKIAGLGDLPSWPAWEIAGGDPAA